MFDELNKVQELKFCKIAHLFLSVSHWRENLRELRESKKKHNPDLDGRHSKTSKGSSKGGVIELSESPKHLQEVGGVLFGQSLLILLNFFLINLAFCFNFPKSMSTVRGSVSSFSAGHLQESGLQYFICRTLE